MFHIDQMEKSMTSSNINAIFAPTNIKGLFLQLPSMYIRYDTLLSTIYIYIYPFLYGSYNFARISVFLVHPRIICRGIILKMIRASDIRS